MTVTVTATGSEIETAIGTATVIVTDMETIVAGPEPHLM